MLSEILLEDDRFESIMQNIHRRAEHHVTYVQPALEKVGERFIRADIEKELGMRHVRTMQSYTDSVYDQIEKSLITLKDCIDNFHAAMKSHYPNDKFVKITKGLEIETPNKLDYSWKNK